jgi:putative cell wall-binding protein
MADVALLLVAALALQLPSISSTHAEAPAVGQVAGAEDRLAGESRIHTAVQISRHQFPVGAQAVYLARADVFADALAAGVLDGGPVLLVPSCGSLPPAVAEEIARLDVTEVVALGGEAAVCQRLAEAAAAGRRLRRLAGPNRFATAVAISQHQFPRGADEVYVVRGEDSPDAVAGGVLTGGPILPVPQSAAVPAIVAAEIERLGPARVVALGGASAISDATLAGAAAGRPVIRLAGANRFETAAAIARYQFAASGSATAFLARADVFADAVAAGALTGGPILLVPRCGGLPSAVEAELGRLRPERVIALGGSAAVCPAQLQHAAAARQSSPADTSVTVKGTGGELTAIAGPIRVTAPAGAIRAGQTLTVKVGDAVGGAPGAAFDAFSVTSSQGNPDRPVRFAMDFSRVGLETNSAPILLHYDDDLRGWVPEATTYDPRTRTATAIVDTFSEYAWSDRVRYHITRFRHQRFTGTLECTAPPDWVTGLILPNGLNDTIRSCTHPSTTSDVFRISIANNRGFPIVLAVKGARVDFSHSFWSDSLTGQIHESWARIANNHQRDYVILAPGSSGVLSIRRPANAHADVRIQPAPDWGMTVGTTLVEFMKTTGGYESFTMPLELTDCIVGNFHTIIDQSKHPSDAIGVVESCVGAAGSLLSATAKSALLKISAALFTIDSTARWLDAFQDMTYPDKIEYTAFRVGHRPGAVKTAHLLGKIAQSGSGTMVYLDRTGYRHALSSATLVACHGGDGNIALVDAATWAAVLNHPAGEAAVCFGGRPGDIIRHPDGDAYVFTQGLRRWIPNAKTYQCERALQRRVVSVARYHIEEIASGSNLPSRNCIIRAAEGDSHFVNNEGRREWIPDAPTYQCEAGRGIEVINTTRTIINSINEVGWHYCLNPALFHGRVLRHADGDTHYIHPDSTRTWIPDGPTYDCRMRQGKALVETRWRQYVDHFTYTGWDYCYDNATLRRKIIKHPDGDSHYVDNAGRRHWIPNTTVYNCLRSQGVPAVTVRWRDYITRTAEREWAVCGNTLRPNERLDRGLWLRSGDGRYNLHMQSNDGNLVLYNAAGRAIWATNRLGGQYAVLQSDGNLVVYKSDRSVVWASNTAGRGANRLVLQNDGNLVLYSPSGAVWASNTAGG